MSESQRPDEREPRDDLPGRGDPSPFTPESLTDMDEEALRRLLREAVDDLEPSPDALEHLQRAVPARRRRKRVLTGAVGTVAVLGIGLPLLFQSGVVPGLSDDGSTTTAQHGNTTASDNDEHPNGGQRQDSSPSQGGSDSTGSEGREDGGDGGASPDTSGTSSPSETLSGVSPSCSRDQLGDGRSSSQPADASGRISGSFVIVNTSDKPCTINDPGMVAVSVQGAARSSDVQVLDNTEGVATTGLPAPEQERDELVLRPKESYVVRFVWLPREGGGASGCRSEATSAGQEDATTGEADGSATGDDTTTGGATGGTEGDGQNDTPADSSVLLGYTPGAGEPRLSTLTLPNACAGTVYRTGILPAGS